MPKKKLKTECSGMSWGDFLVLVDQLKKMREYKFLLFVSLGSYCGLRANDILRLRWSDIIDCSEILIEESKTGKTRRISINENLKEIIDLCFRKFNETNKKGYGPDSIIFHNRSGNILSLQFINRKLHELFKACNITVQNPSSHTFRKTFAKKIYEMNKRSEASLIMLSHIFNHSSLTVTRKYIGIIQEQIQDVYLSL